MNELKPQLAEQAHCSANAELAEADVMRALENGRYIDADEFWNSRPENINKEGNFIDGWFYCLDRFSRHLKEMINKPSVTKAALALLREKDALLAEWDAKCNDYETALMGKDAEIERLMREKTALECVVATARNQGRAEAISEFAERLKEGMQDLARIDFGGVTVFAVGEAFIDRIAKKMKESQGDA